MDFVEWSSVLSNTLNIVGALVFLYVCLHFLFTVFCGIRTYLLSGFWRVDLKSYGEWAVVTGATSGIGKEYANELAKRGLNVVLISRSLTKLKQTAAEIEKQHGRKTQVIQADFTSGSHIYKAIEAALNDLNIGILVNNVGMLFSEFPEYFLDAEDCEKRISDVINCNVLSVPQMTRIVLPKMVERRKGVIINLSSAAANHPVALMTMYSASKAFVDFFSRSLNAEYKSKGILVQCIMPYYVSTNLINNKEPSMFIKKADDFAREALNTVGISDRTNGCLAHAIENYFIELLFPEWFRLTSFTVNSMVEMSKKEKELSQKKEE
ncbi:very-long-chain 3-oxoacyl-CoA reductase-like [Protopterus annectens]|uniref:very-long-chain 3-oxoacyl-CoA reductase-like n=1 Tax=Protopterus annectens TaxID=7888 RepID=UPI001CFAFF9F|nr:very-long-chain 3-oxoacyl-CoA reductase-like [Protopterus annectens]